MLRIAIDGPGGAGKSSLAKAVAARLGIIYVDTGALYRTIGLYMVNHGISPKDEQTVVANLDKFNMELKFEDGKQVILLDGQDVGDTIRTPEISMAASAVSAIPAVRTFLLNTQRSIAERHSVIMDGRDIGTVILPKAEVKIFLTASPEARAKRRYDELIGKGKEVKYAYVYNAMVERDTNDSTRAVAPCVPAEDALILDNSDLTAEGTVEAVLKIIKKAKKKFNKKTSYMKARVIVGPLVKLFTHAKATGLENIPKEGGFIICANHIAARDVLILGACCPRQIKFIAKKELFKIPVIGSIMRSFGAVSLDRGGNDVGAIRASVELIKNGDLVSLFPQGHRFPGVDPANTPIKSGAGMLAYRSGCDVIPAYIKVKKNKYALFRRVKVIFGKPISYKALELDKGGTEEYKRATEIIFREIINLDPDRLLLSSADKEN